MSGHRGTVKRLLEEQVIVDYVNENYGLEMAIRVAEILNGPPGGFRASVRSSLIREMENRARREGEVGVSQA